MKNILWIDQDGFKRRSLVRDTDGIDRIRQGIPVEFPDVYGDGWNELAKEIANILVEDNVRTYADLLHSQPTINAISNVVKRRIIDSYRNASKSNQ